MRYSSVLNPLLALVVLVLFDSGAIAQGNEFPNFTQLVEQYSAAVISIDVKSTKTESRSRTPELPGIPENSPLHKYFKRFFEQLPEELQPHSQNSMGSGFIISPDGFILTNAHVVEGMDTITVGLSDRRELPAKVIGTDARSDTALLKIEADKLPTVKIGDSDKLQVGQWVLAIGSPFGFAHSATQGIISALGRSLPKDNYIPFIQTDAAVNPGNSGGPLFNLDGEVIGVNSQIYSRSGGYQGLSFAIPINIAMEVADQLKSRGKVTRGWLGVLIQEVTPDLAQSFGLEKPRGALVGQVLADGPAQQAGVKVGDIITAFNNQTVLNSSDLPPLVGRTRPGSTATLNLIRDGKEQTLTVKIQELPDNIQEQAAAAKPGLGNRLKLRVSNQPDGKGVKVEEVGEGPAARAGVQPGDVILNLNNQDITDARQFEALIKDLPADKPFPVLIQRGGNPLFLAMILPKS
ncbi:MAG: DegQ family serine endoprotease [Candidatus Competibacteraceae bacterium]